MTSPPTPTIFASSPDIAIPDWHLAEIGRCAVFWSDFEFAIDTMIWELMGVSAGIGACVTAQLIAPIPKLRAVRTLAETRGVGDRTLSLIGKLEGRTGGLSEKRNRIIHDKRAVRMPDRAVIRFEVTAKKSLHMDPKVETIFDLKAFMDEVITAIREFDQIQASIRADISAPPSESRNQPPQVLILGPNPPSETAVPDQSEIASREKRPRRRDRSPN